MQASVGKPSVPVIVYLYAHRLVPRESLPIGGTEVPCTDMRVQSNALAVLLFATSFWSLRRQGLIDMELVQSRRGSIFPQIDVRVRLSDHRDRSGLEGALITNLEDDGTVREVISRWARYGSTNPWRDVISGIVKEAVAEEFIREAQVSRGVIARLLGGGRELEPDCGRITALEEKFDAFASSWQEFQGREKLLHDRLCGQCKKSLMACAEYWIA